MSNKGWIKVWRKSEENSLYFLEPFTKWQAWLDLIVIANHKDGIINVRGNIISIKRGQVGWSEEALAKRWKWSRNKVRNFLKYLEKVQQIEQQKSPILSLITIINYNSYQQEGTTESTTESTTERQQKVQQKDTNKNEKEYKELKNDIYTDNFQKENKKGTMSTKGDVNHRFDIILEVAGKFGIDVTFYPISIEGFILDYTIEDIRNTVTSCCTYLKRNNTQKLNYSYFFTSMNRNQRIHKEITKDDIFEKAKILFPKLNQDNYDT